METTAECGLQERVRRLAVEAGFATAGIAPLPRLDEQEAEAHARYFSEWVEQGHAGEMEYLKRRDALGRFVRSAVEVAVPWARSIVVCAAPYGGGAGYPLSTEAADPGTGWIGRYAWSGRETESGGLAPSDYHKVLLRRLKRVEASLKQELGEFQSWAYVDTGPMVERAFSAMAGIGWTGKNVCTLSEELGSFFFLGVIVTSLEVQDDQRATLPADRCGSCTRCLDACPTGALIAPRQMDASRCIAYLTIEKRGAIEEELRPGVGRQIFGCDICQDVCPWNTRARREPAVEDSELRVRGEMVNPSLGALAALTEAEWEGMFFGSPVKRARFSGFRRNLAIAMGNSGEAELLPQLERWSREEEPDAVLRETSRWAVGRLMARETPR
jgi:epoxyqueuosine reductase